MMERLVVTIETNEPTAPREVDTFFERRGWKKMGDNRWESVFISKGFAARQTHAAVEEVVRQFSELHPRVTTRRNAASEPIHR